MQRRRKPAQAEATNAGVCGAKRCSVVAAFLLCMLAPLTAAAQQAETQPERVVIHHDTILRYVPRYELTLQTSAVSSSTQFWRRVDQVPVYERISLDASGIGNRPIEVHVSAWGAADATMPSQSQGQLLSGDFATAYAKAGWRSLSGLSGLSAWGGRRFVTWGLPGGLHLDGVGIEERTKSGLFFEAIAGRPVTSVSTVLGAHSEYTQPTVAYGARVGYDRPGKITAAGSYIERWGNGIAANRALMGTVAYRPHERLDLLASSTFDVRSGLEEARVQASYLVSDEIEPELAYIHADPQKLLPSWSILSMFATDVYDEGVLGVTGHVTHDWSARVELGMRRSYLPGAPNEGATLGYRTDASVRFRPLGQSTEVVCEISRRDEGQTALFISRLAAAFVPYHPLRIAPELGAAVDEHDGKRTALLARLSAELPLGSRWTSALSADLARTPIALLEVRSLLRVSYVLDGGSH